MSEQGPHGIPKAFAAAIEAMADTTVQGGRCRDCVNATLVVVGVKRALKLGDGRDVFDFMVKLIAELCGVQLEIIDEAGTPPDASDDPSGPRLH